MSLTSSLLSRVLGGGSCSREELIALSREPLEELCQAANAIREHFCGNVFDLCTIINGRSGKCSETASTAPSPPITPRQWRNIPF